ncbi:MAG: SGNH/GDSL hydrolase family protein, partial [Pyrinomonadaceae bacterium]
MPSLQPQTAPITGPNLPPVPSGPITYVALGDSTGVGVGARDGGYVSRLFKRLVDERPKSKLVNLCVSGAATSEVLTGQLDRAVR